MTNKLEAMNQLFDRIKDLCPAWKQAWPTDERELGAKRAWLDAFQIDNITTQEQLNRGMKALYRAKTEFVPSPGKFVEMCKPTADELGCPSIDQAYLEAARNSHIHSDKQWTHSAVKYAFDEVGKETFRTQTAARVREKFVKSYKSALEMAVADTLPPLPYLDIPSENKALEGTSKPYKPSKLVGAAAIKEIKAMLSGKPSSHECTQKRCHITLLRPIADFHRINIADIERKFLSRDDITDLEDRRVSFKELRNNVKQWIRDGMPDVVNTYSDNLETDHTN